jgi:acyl carrier protein
MDIDQIRRTVRDYIVKEFLPGEKPEALTDSTPLVTGGILDSLATLKLVSFLEGHFRISIAAHEADAENLDTVTRIAALVAGKRPAS